MLTKFFGFAGLAAALTIREEIAAITDAPLEQDRVAVGDSMDEALMTDDTLASEELLGNEDLEPIDEKALWQYGYSSGYSRGWSSSYRSYGGWGGYGGFRSGWGPYAYGGYGPGIGFGRFFY